MSQNLFLNNPAFATANILNINIFAGWEGAEGFYKTKNY